ncbi:MAG: hypothetical protein AABX51_02790 [Nanoarchaeota archaeon]
MALFPRIWSKWFFLKEIAKESVAGLPDFLVINSTNAFFVESKSKLDGIKPIQKEIHARIKERGFDVEIFCLPIDQILISYGKGRRYHAELA